MVSSFISEKVIYKFIQKEFKKKNKKNNGFDIILKIMIIRNAMTRSIKVSMYENIEILNQISEITNERLNQLYILITKLSNSFFI